MNGMREKIALVVEEALARHGIAPDRVEGTLDDADTILSTIEAEGFVLVPKEPSEEMLRQGAFVRHVAELGLSEIWEAMLSTASKEQSDGR